MKIAIFSSANSFISKENKELALGIVNYLKKYNVTLVTGGSLGIPGFMIEEYKKIGGKTIMYSPDKCSNSHNLRHDNHSIDYYDEVIYGEGFTERSLKMIHNIDGAIALNGRTGTLCEVLIGIEESLPVIVIDSANGICENFQQIFELTRKPAFGFLEIGSSYGNQIDKLIDYIKKHS